MKIKFNNIRDLSDARYAAAAMADWIGFSVGSPDSLPAGKIQEIIGWCAGPALILEVAPNTGSDVIQSMITVLPVAGLEVQEADLNRLRTELSNENLSWMIWGASPSSDLIALTDRLQRTENLLCLVDAETTSAEAIRNTDPWGISLNCREGDTTGMKNYDDWNDLFENLEIL